MTLTPFRYVPALPLVIALCQFGLVDAQEALAQVPRTFRRATSAGREVAIYTHTNYGHDCSSDALPSITVTAPPTHGTIFTRPDTVVVHDPPLFGDTDCRGKMISGIAVIYRPAPAFVGSDRFEYSVHLSKGIGTVIGLVEVK